MDAKHEEPAAGAAATPSPVPTKLRYEIFTDPLYGSERYIEFLPDWVQEAHDGIFRAVPWILRSRHYDVTYITFKNDKRYIVWGHHTAEIHAGQQQG